MGFGLLLLLPFSGVVYFLVGVLALIFSFHFSCSSLLKPPVVPCCSLCVACDFCMHVCEGLRKKRGRELTGGKEGCRNDEG